MIPVGTLVPGAVAEVIRKAPLTPEKVAFAWRMAVGPAIDKATRISLDDGGVLQVRVDTAAWASALRKSSSLILSRLETLLGSDAVLQIDITQRR
jgi:hypothetical protein